MKLKQKIKCVFNGRFGPLPTPEKWVFIVGCYNSGTTLLHDILATHPRVGSMIGEGQFFTDQLKLPKDEGLPRLWALAPEKFRLDEGDGQKIDINKLKRQWGAYYDNPTKPILIEKSPTNVARVRWLQKNFENAFFIGIIRNGYAVAEGIHRKAGHSLDLAAQQWGISNAIMLRDFEALHNKIMISYEELAENSSDVIGRIYKFLSLDSNYGTTSSEQIWQIHEQASPIQNMNARSFDALTEEDFLLINTIAGDLLDKLNYLKIVKKK